MKPHLSWLSPFVLLCAFPTEAPAQLPPGDAFVLRDTFSGSGPFPGVMDTDSGAVSSVAFPQQEMLRAVVQDPVTGDFFATRFLTGEILRIELSGTASAQTELVGGVEGATFLSLALGPNGDLFAANSNSEIYRFDRASGAASLWTTALVEPGDDLPPFLELDRESARLWLTRYGGLGGAPNSVLQLDALEDDPSVSPQTEYAGAAVSETTLDEASEKLFIANGLLSPWLVSHDLASGQTVFHIDPFDFLTNASMLIDFDPVRQRLHCIAAGAFPKYFRFDPRTEAVEFVADLPAAPGDFVVNDWIDRTEIFRAFRARTRPSSWRSPRTVRPAISPSFGSPPSTALPSHRSCSPSAPATPAVSSPIPST